MPRYLVLFFLLTTSKLSFSQINHPQNKQELIAVCNKFMDTFKSEQYEQAFNLIKPYSVIENYKLDTMASTVTRQMAMLSDSYGKLVGYEQTAVKEIKLCLIKVVYIVKFEKSFLELHFILYNSGTGTGWTITSFKYDEETGDLF
jgi:hypothetical protein